MSDDTRKWQDHPVLIAIGSGAAALIFAQTVIFPTMTASLQSEVSAARSQMQEISTLREQSKKALEEAAKAKLEVKAAQLNNVFSVGNPYPIGLTRVKIGDGPEAILSNFPEGAVTKSSATYWSVKIDHGAFSHVAYYFDRPKSLQDRKIRSLLLFANERASGVIGTKLIDALGNPATTGPKSNCSIWSLSKDLFVQVDGPNALLLANTQPSCAIEEK